MLTRTRRARRGLAVATAVVSLVVLAACSSGGADTSSTDELVGEVPDEETTLTVWSYMPGEFEGGPQAYDEIVSAFEEKYPQVTVDFVSVPYPTYFDKVRKATVARQGPDVVSMFGGAQAYSFRTGLLPLQDSIQPEIESNLRFIEESYSQDGNLYILPTGTYGYTLGVNQDEFDKAGVDPATALGSWDGLLQACQTMSDAGVQPIGSGWKDGYMFEAFMYMITSQLMDTETLAKWTQGEIPVDDPLFVQATEHIVEMNDAGCFGDSAALERSMYDDAFNQYYDGESAMMIVETMNRAQQAYEAQPSSTVMGLPQVPGSHYTDLVDAGPGSGWAVTNWTKSPEAAGALANFLVSPEAQDIIWKASGVAPNLKDVNVTGSNAIQKDYLALIENPVNHTGFASFPLPVLATYERNAAPLMNNKMTVAEFTEQAQSAYEQAN